MFNVNEPFEFSLTLERHQTYDHQTEKAEHSSGKNVDTESGAVPVAIQGHDPVKRSHAYRQCKEHHQRATVILSFDRQVDVAGFVLATTKAVIVADNSAPGDQADHGANRECSSIQIDDLLGDYRLMILDKILWGGVPFIKRNALPGYNQS